MAQTMNGKNSVPQKQQRPGQRQKDRLQRLARRRRRRQIWTSVIVVVVVAALTSLTVWQYQRITAQQKADSIATATVVAKARARAVATAVTQNCFVSSSGVAVPPIYESKATPTAGPAKAPLITGTPVTTADGLKYVDIKMGTGRASTKTSTVTVEYTGWVAGTCTKFDSSYDHGGQSFPVPLGKGQVIPGFEQGLMGVKAGGVRRIYIPPALGYGSQAQQTIPANSTLIFDVTIISVK